jgi:hypothetical protein
VEQARGRSLSFGIAERSAQLSSIPIGYVSACVCVCDECMCRAQWRTDSRMCAASGVGAKWKSWGWISRGLLYFNQPGRLVRGPELLTGGMMRPRRPPSLLSHARVVLTSSRPRIESAWGYRQGDRVGIYVDLQRGVLAFFLNGRQIAPAHEDPDLASNLEPLYPTVVGKPRHTHLRSRTADGARHTCAYACARVCLCCVCRALAGEATAWCCSSGWRSPRSLPIRSSLSGRAPRVKPHEHRCRTLAHQRASSPTSECHHVVRTRHTHTLSLSHTHTHTALQHVLLARGLTHMLLCPRSRSHNADLVTRST